MIDVMYIKPHRATFFIRTVHHDWNVYVCNEVSSIRSSGSDWLISNHTTDQSHLQIDILDKDKADLIEQIRSQEDQSDGQKIRVLQKDNAQVGDSQFTCLLRLTL